jgi:proline dehydrogenase
MLRTLLLELAKRPGLGRWITSYNVTRRIARRFVPGEELSEALEAARRSNAAGMSVSLDELGENVSSREDAERARDTYTNILDHIAAEHLDANISLKLTHLGLDLGEEFCESQLRAVIERAAALQNFVRVDMEGSAYTERTLRIVKEVRAETDAVGTVIQAYLYRSRQDVEDLLEAGCRIRLVKGAYKEPPAVAIQRKRDVDANFVSLTRLLLSSGLYHAIATHDPNMIDAAIRYAARHSIPKDKFEFQMLYGVRTDLQRRLVRDGYRFRVYIPYGKDWFPYFMRRLAERPANLLFLLKNLFRGADASE